MSRPVLVLVVVAALLCCCSGSTPKPSHSNKGNPSHFTIMHVTDVHGWVMGHPHDPELNADFGDWTSLLYFMRRNAAAANTELLLFDSGDLIEGTGLSDATPVHGLYIFPIVLEVQQASDAYDAFTMGNHDMGHPSTIDLITSTFIPPLNPVGGRPRYLTANTEMAGTGQFLGPPYSFFQTPHNGYNVLSIGFIYNFTQGANNTVVTPVADALEQPWFAEAMELPADLIVVTAHIDPMSPPTLLQIYTAIRNVHPHLPLILLVGHRHMLVYEIWDQNCFVLESGKYFEQIGLLQFDLDDSLQIQNMNQTWINTSTEKFAQLAQVPLEKMTTPAGQAIKTTIAKYWSELQLSTIYGCTPVTYSPYVPLNSTGSFYTLYVNSLIPKTIFNPAAMPAGHIQFFMCNSATLRYYFYEGTINKNDIYTIDPFGDQFYFYGGITGVQLTQLIQAANAVPPEFFDSLPAVPEGMTVMPRHRCGDTAQSSGLPSFVTPDVVINTTATYDLVLAAYDSVTLLPLLQQLFGQQWTKPLRYPSANNLNATGALVQYVTDFMQCSTSCPCPQPTVSTPPMMPHHQRKNPYESS